MEGFRKEWIALGGLLAFLVYIGVMNMAYLGNLVSLPSPIYGGDYYHQLGHVHHFMQGGGFMESLALYDALPTYMPLYPYLVALMAKGFGMTGMDAIFLSSLLFTAVSLLLWFILLKTVFEEAYPVVFVGLALVAFQNSIIIKYTDFALAVHLPLFLLALYYIVYRRNFYTALFFGLVYGLSALTYTIMFVGATLLVLLLLTYELATAWRGKRFGAYWQENWRYAIAVLATSVPVALVYWYEPVFLDHLHMYYNRAKLDFPDFGLPAVQIAFLKEKIGGTFFNFSSLQGALFSLLRIAAVGILFIDRSSIRFFVGGYFAASLFIVFSYFLTEPLLGTNFIPERQSLFFLGSSTLLLTLYGLRYLMGLLKFDRRYTAVGVTAIALLLLVQGHANFLKREQDHWYQKGMKPMNPLFADLGTYLREHTTAEEVVVTTKELGFALNAVGGNKLITGRWAHNGSPYTDLSQRDVDLAIILYGSDEAKKRELLKKYRASYLFWGDYWVSSEFQFNRKGQLVDTYDPLIAFDTAVYRDQLLANRVAFFPRRFWLEPSVRREDVKQYDILTVAPQNYRSFQRPWHRNLDSYLTKVWSYEDRGREVAALYRIRY